MEQLQKILQQMDVPSLRLNDLGWLNRNLAIKNQDHPLFEEAMQIIKSEIRKAK